jgi:hypothetical protein
MTPNAHLLAMKYDPEYRARVEAAELKASIGSISARDAAEMELTRLLLIDHRYYLKMSPDYRAFIERYGGKSKSDQVEAGLRYQKRVFATQTRSRHIEIWRLVRAHEDSHKLRVAPAGVGAFRK